MAELNFEDLTAEQKEFKAALKSASIPVTEEDIKAEFQAIVEASGMEITNTSYMSPFWQLITAIATKPVLWLLAFMIKYVMPDLYVKTAGGWFLDLLADTYDIERKPATKAVGELTFTRDSVGQPLTIPEGAIIRTISINGTIYRMIVKTATDFEANSSTVKVLCEAENIGTAYNLGTAYYSILETDIPGVTSVSNETDWLQVPGDDEETDDLLRLRVRNQFTAVSQWHTDAKYRAMITEQTGIRADYVFFDHEIPRGPGSADAYILFDTYAPAQSYIDQLNAYILDNGNHGHGDDILIKVLPETQHDISVHIVFESNVSDTATLKSNIEQFIRCAFRENSSYGDYVTQTWAFDRFSWSRLDQELHNYFSGVDSFTWGQDDIVSNLDVPRINTLTITSD